MDSQTRHTTTIRFLWMVIALVLAIAILLIIYILGPKPASPASYRHTTPGEYYLYAPPAYTAEKSWPLFIGIHGSGGSGLDCWNMWQAYADENEYILLCPSLADRNGGWYQESGEKLLFKILNEVVTTYRVQPRYYLAGFSAGAQFTQGMVSRFPGLVRGAAILSAGNYPPASLAALNIPLLVVTGDRDAPASVSNYHAFVNTMRAKGFNLTDRVLPGVGHQVTAETISLVLEHYRRIYGH